ncbi:G-type lectin S-receptor-like serine/threonine-protein kinase B120 [Nymphaea colorata]|nr:G-type lectin S-receptor-like serine/threonine-protein kinase B120 [Nymphaea colorata]
MVRNIAIESLLVCLLHYFIFFSVHLRYSSAQKTSIPLGQSLKLNETLVSPGNVFALGFFTPNGSSFVYLGIWYAALPGRTVVWVANRANPIQANDSGALLTLSLDGTLAVVDGNTSRLWYANSSSSTSPGNDTTAALSDDGRLAVSGNQVTYWDSFGDPSDTFLPAMGFITNTTSGKSVQWTSWASVSDPSPGRFSLGLTRYSPTNPIQLYLLNGSALLWRTGPLSGRIFSGLPNMSIFSIYGFNPSQNGDEFTLGLNSGSSRLNRFVVDPAGVVKQSNWSETAGAWVDLWKQPGGPCDRYNWCGSFGLCDPLNATDVCGCLPGFEARSGTGRDGCVRRTQFGCGTNGSGFRSLPSVKPPDQGTVFANLSSQAACQAACLGNCSCTAYIYTSGTGCIMWFGDLLDILQFSGETDGLELFLKLAPSEIAGAHGRKYVKIYVPSILGAVILVACIFCLWRQKGRLNELWKRNGVGSSMVSYMGTLDHVAESGRRVEENGEGLPLLDLASVRAATNGFSLANKLGEGGFGPVYRGKLSGGQEIAVKRLSRNSGQGAQEFMNEARLIAKLQHRNLVKLVGCCVEEDEKILVYEYMPNKSLDAFLFDEALGRELDWERRYTIVLGIARGLLYLHQDSRLRVVHRDLKASNILLDAAMNPKISDFGIARIFGGDQTQEINTIRVVGTYGYMSPEYAMEGRFSIKSDVFSFGVLVLEIVSGKRMTRFHHPDLSLNLLGYAWKLWNEGRAQELLDPSLTASSVISSDQVVRWIHVGLLCVQDDETDRPTMSTVVVMLGSEASNLPPPSMPAYSSRRRRTAGEANSTSTDGSGIDQSVNLVTITAMEAR